MTRDVHRATERLDPVYQANKAGPIGYVGSPDSVVADRKTKVGTLGFDAPLRGGGSCVFGRVSKGLCHNVVRGHFDGLQQPSLNTHVELDRDGRAAGGGGGGGGGGGAGGG